MDLTGYDEEFHRRGAGGDRLMLRALANPPGALDPAVVNGRAWRSAEIPAVNGHGTARGVAGAADGFDRVVGAPAAWGLGVGVDEDGWGMGGTGGSFGWWSRAVRAVLGLDPV